MRERKRYQQTIKNDSSIHSTTVEQAESVLEQLMQTILKKVPKLIPRGNQNEELV